MKSTRRLATAFVLTCAVFLAQQSQAYLELTYTSDVVPWDYALLYGQYDDVLGTFYPPSFTLSFSSAQDSLSASTPTTFSMVNPQVSVDPELLQEIFVEPSSNGSVTVNPDGSVAEWDIFLALSEFLRPGDFDAGWNLKIFSKGGEGSCNCDRVEVKGNLYTDRRDEYVLLGPIEIYYRGPNDSSNWSVNAVKVPAPNPGWMMLSALVMMLFVAWRRNRCRFLPVA